MFRKRSKRTFPEGTFIPFPARLCAILQLCIAFGMILWYTSQPFMGELFEIKSEKLLLHYAIDQRELFEQLPRFQQEELLSRLLTLQDRLEIPFLTKLMRSGEILIHLPLLKLTWIVLAILLSIFLLKKREGARQALWLLPFLALAYGVDNRIQGLPTQPTAEEKLFPSESYLRDHYLDEPWGSTLFEQKQQLEQAWNHYLQLEWGGQNQSLSQGLYAFNLARIQAQPFPKAERTFLQIPPTQESLPFLFLIIFWNLTFALVCTITTKKDYYLINS